MKNGILILACLINFSLSFSIMAGGCESGFREIKAYGAAIQEEPYFKLAISAPEKMNRVSSEGELQAVWKGLESAEKRVRRTESDYLGCLGQTYNEMLTRDMRFNHGASSGDELVEIALKKIAEAKVLYPIAQDRLKQMAIKRQNEIAEAKRINEETRIKLELEQKEIAELEEKIKEQRELEELQAFESRRIELERQATAINYSQADLAGATNKSRKTSDSKPYIGEKGFSSGMNDNKAGDGYILNNRVVCTSQLSHDSQIELLVNDQIRLASGCFATPENQNAYFIDSSWGQCIVKRVSDGKKLWLDCGDFNYW